MSDTFTQKTYDTPGYIIAWKYKYEYKTGKEKDKVMSYGEAKRHADELSAIHPERSFWPEKLEPPAEMKKGGH